MSYHSLPKGFAKYASIVYFQYLENKEQLRKNDLSRFFVQTLDINAMYSVGNAKVWETL